MYLAPSFKGEQKPSETSQHGLKKGDALSSLLFNFGLQSAITNVQENQPELEVNVKQQLLRHPILI